MFAVLVLAHDLVGSVDHLILLSWTKPKGTNLSCPSGALLLPGEAGASPFPSFLQRVFFEAALSTA